MKILKKIMLPIIILALFSTVFFTLPNNYEVKHQHQKSCSICLTIDNIKSDINALSSHTCNNSSKCLYCNKVASSKNTLILLTRVKHKCIESSNILSYNNIKEHINDDFLIFAILILIVSMIFLILIHIKLKNKLSLYQPSLISLKVKMLA